MVWTMTDGHATPGRGDEELELDELEPVFADLRSVFVRPASPEVAADHIARMTAAAREAATLSVAPAQSRRRADAAEHPWRRKVAIVAAAFGAAVLGTGGLAVAGALPGPVQDAVATVVEPFGVDLPRSDDSKSDDPGDTDGTSNKGGGGSGTNEAPGQTGQTPGQSGETPANGSEPPGQSGTAPGQSGENPGNSGNAPGQSGEPPGNSGNAPGQGGSGSPNAGGSNPNAGGGNPNAGGDNPNAGSGNNNAGGNSAGGAANGNGNGGNSGNAPGQNK